jgi:hypothetical protein
MAMFENILCVLGYVFLIITAAALIAVIALAAVYVVVGLIKMLRGEEDG